MKRLTIAIDEVAKLRHILEDDRFDPAQYAVLCEVAGAHGISVTITEIQKGIRERDVQLIKQLRKSFFNLHIPLTRDFIKLALSVNPDMVTFVEQALGDRGKIVPLETGKIFELLVDAIPDFHANNVSVAVLSPPEVGFLKQLNKIKIDYVELSCYELTEAVDSNEEIVALDKLSAAAMVAAKLGLGVNCFGGVDYSHLAALATMSRLEDICMGRNIFRRAMIVGIQQAVQEALQQVLFYQKD